MNQATQAPKSEPDRAAAGINRLEAARAELERVRKTIASAGDYLERGRPTPAERAETTAAIRAHAEQAQALDHDYQALLAHYRRHNPAVVNAWVQLHRDILAAIMAETASAQAQQSLSHKTRLRTARQTALAWQEVAQGKRSYVSINHYYLPDYQRRLDRFKNRPAGAKPTD